MTIYVLAIHLLAMDIKPHYFPPKRAALVELIYVRISWEEAKSSRARFGIGRRCL